MQLLYFGWVRIKMGRVAVNQELTDLDAAVANNDEIALFPPMTGG